MPTTKPRYQITDTDEVALALDAAELRWPGEPRSRLVVRLLVESGLRMAEVGREEAARRRAAIEAFDAGFSEAYPPGYLEELRKDWPE
ncbi:hypothetical protein [Homoserinibacter sp. YIM 151385]|uniref:hypothetical protein n=1 Tax=Homoserinibacter sp. YIM 151385 TaxID=2985506 RepID=UPI0022F052AB|nr:hypothetical protein [Homoserinibacter sp. YIM 151385]WBU36945.1 hypothetical protein OF852_08375 [Homoserinibacter sp. YIM 151385]